MATNVLSPPSLDSESACVLAAYGAAQPLAVTEVADDDAAGWIPRLAMVEQVSPERMAPIHGRLIALGLLKFQLLDRSGMVYRLSPEGRFALGGTPGCDDRPSTESADGTGDPAAQEEAPRE